MNPKPVCELFWKQNELLIEKFWTGFIYLCKKELFLIQDLLILWSVSGVQINSLFANMMQDWKKWIKGHSFSGFKGVTFIRSFKTQVTFITKRHLESLDGHWHQHTHNHIFLISIVIQIMVLWIFWRNGSKNWAVLCVAILANQECILKSSQNFCCCFFSSIRGICKWWLQFFIQNLQSDNLVQLLILVHGVNKSLLINGGWSKLCTESLRLPFVEQQHKKC